MNDKLCHEIIAAAPSEVALKLVNAPQGRTTRVKDLEQYSDYYRNIRNQLLAVLQTTLELDELLEMFFNQMHELLGINAMSYQSSGESPTYEYGHGGRHHCSYTLNHANQNLGELNFKRKQRFLDEELHVLEYLIGTLFFPLRNCLLYRDAVQSAHTDPLTGLGSRTALVAALEREFGIARRQQWPLSMLVVDIDLFKRINDTYGHSFGDKVLKEVASVIRSCLRSTDQSFRYGGEEFVVVLSKTDEAQAQRIAERIRLSVASISLKHLDEAITTTVSIGVAQAGDDDDSISLFDRADHALYQAKHNGRNQIQTATMRIIA